GYRRRDMSVKIYDISGRVVKLFNHLTVQPINYVFWDATDNAGRRVASGTYFVVIKDGEEVLAKQAVYVR
ncbi:MAG: T9SS type A sorting domain-containing protein, partial [candidate division WOR-3 bacterium]